MKLERDTYIGAITAIAYSPDGKYIVCGYFSESKSLSIGSGASLLIYDSQTFGFLKSIRVLKKALVHGIRFCKLVILIYEN